MGQGEVMEFLEASGDWEYTRDIAKAIGNAQSSTSNVLARLFKHGEVYRKSGGSVGYMFKAVLD